MSRRRMAHLWFKLRLNNYEIPGGVPAGWLRGCPESVLLYLAPRRARARCARVRCQDTVICMCIVCRYFTTGDTRTVENSSLTSRVTPEHLLSPKSRKLPY